MVASATTIGQLYVVLNRHVPAERMDALIDDLTREVQGNASVRETIGNLRTLHLDAKAARARVAARGVFGGRA